MPNKRVALAAVIAVLAFPSVFLAAPYDFLTVTTTGVQSSQFTSPNGNGFITVTDAWSGGGPAALENVNSAIFPSQFQTLFPGSGQVQGHLYQTNTNSSSTMVFDLTNYSLTSATVFGIWNIIDESFAVVYNIQLLDSGSNLVDPTTFNLIGNQDNETQVAGRTQLVLNTSTGDLQIGALINPNGTHTNAAFFDHIAVGTKQIVITSNIGNLSTGDGVGFYFAELHPVPEPSSIILSCMGLVAVFLGTKKNNRKAASRT
jgi:hypothetical protein